MQRPQLKWKVPLFLWALVILALFTPNLLAVPTASFTFTVDSSNSNPPFFVYLDARHSSPGFNADFITDYEWSDSEGHFILPGAVAATTFASIGTYSVTLTVRNDQGEAATTTKVFTVGNALPPPPVTNPINTNNTANTNNNTTALPIPNFKVTGTNGLTVNVDASASRPGSSGSNTNTITKYEYYATLGTTNKGPFNLNTAMGSFTLDVPGNYTISLYVTDNMRLSSSKPALQRNVLVGITNDVNQSNQTEQNNSQTTQQPTANFTVSRIDGLNVYLDASASKPASNATAIIQYEYRWQRGTDFGRVPFTFINQAPPHLVTLPAAGTYSISLKVVDNLGNSSTTPFVVNNVTVPANTPVDNNPLPVIIRPEPQITVQLTPSFKVTRTDGLTVYVDASGSRGSSITKYEYQTTISGNPGKTYTFFNTPSSFTLDEPGTYTISLYITDSHGIRSTTSSTQTVTVAPKLKPRFTVENIPTLIGSYLLDASNSTVSTNTAYTWKIDGIEIGQGPSLTITLNEGIHKLELALIDNFGQSESLAHYIYVPKTQLNPIPRFTVTQQRGDRMFSLDASNSFDPDGGSIASYQWIIGGVNISNDAIVFYQPTASTDITLTVTDRDFGSISESVTANITVENGNVVMNPVANFQTYDVKSENNKILSTMEFDISGSFHPDADKNDSLISEWFIGANQEDQCQTRSTNQDVLEVDDSASPTHNIRFTKTGNYFLCLKVSDEDGREDTKGITVSIANSYTETDPSFADNKGGQAIKGGVLVKNEFLPKGSAISSNTFVDIVAELTATGGFPTEGGELDVYVVVALGYQFYMMDAEIESFRVWDGQIGNLLPAYKNISFSNGKIHIPIFSGKIKGVIPTGTYQVFVAYDWSEVYLDLNRVVFNPTDPITFTVVDDSP